MTDQQKAFVDALRAAGAAAAAVEGTTPITEDQAAAILGGVNGQSGLDEIRAKRDRMRSDAYAAEATLLRRRKDCELQLGRPLTPHEAGSAFGTTEHAWWLESPFEPCVLCLGAERAALIRSDPPGAYRRLLPSVGARVEHAADCDCLRCLPVRKSG